MSTHNKFLQKRAADKSPGFFTNIAAQAKQVMDTAQDAKSLYQLLNGTGYDHTQIPYLQASARRLRDYQSGIAPQGYNPTRDMDTVQKLMNHDKFVANYNNMLKTDPENRVLNRFKQGYNNRHAFRYAAQNPEEFKKFQNFRGMGISDYLFGSTEDNYNLLRMANGPMGAFLSPEQRKKLRDNYGIMKLIWRIKKFFSEFGNWKNTPDPENYKYTPAPTNRPAGTAPATTPTTTTKPTTAATNMKQRVGSLAKDVKVASKQMGLPYVS